MSFLFFVYAIAGFIVTFTLAEPTEYDFNYAFNKMYSMKHHLEFQIKDNAIMNQHAACLREVTSHKIKLNETTIHLSDWEQKVKQRGFELDEAQILVLNLQKEFKEEMHAWRIETTPEIKKVNEVIALLMQMREMTIDLKVRNPKRTETVDRLVKLIDRLIEEAQQRIKDLEFSPLLEQLKLTISHEEENVRRLLQWKQNAEKNIVRISKLIAELEQLLSSKESDCEDLELQLERFIKDAGKDIELLNDVISIMRNVEHNDLSNEVSTIEFNKNSLLKTIQNLISVTRGHLTNLNDPNPKCQNETLDLKRNVAMLQQQTSEIELKIPKLNDQIRKKDEEITELKSETFLIQGELKQIDSDCHTYGKLVVQDPNLLDEIDGINKILSLVSDLESKNKLSRDSSKRMQTILNGIRLDLLKLMEERFEAAAEKYNACKSKFQSVQNIWEKKMEEIQSLSMASTTLADEVGNANEELIVLRSDKKTNEESLFSTVQKCKELLQHFESETQLHERDLNNLIKIVHLLQK